MISPIAIFQFNTEFMHLFSDNAEGNEVIHAVTIGRNHRSALFILEHSKPFSSCLEVL